MPIYGQAVKLWQGVLNRISFNSYLRTLELTTPGFFIGRKQMDIDYTKLNNRVVQQAWEVNNLTLTEEMKTRLFQNKLRRAAEMLQAREQGVYFKIEN
jgi:hypothetical protein